LFGTWENINALKVKVPFMESMLESALQNSSIEMFLQVFVILLEIAVGLALIAGLFTTVSAMASLALQFMFLTSTGLYLTGWWMIPASIAVMFGAGQVFSFDYYIMPCLKRWWKRRKIVKKWYLYHD
jgi:NADH dehydrogenase